MNTLKKFVEYENEWRKLCKQPPYDLDNDNDRECLKQILEGKLSPENLTCDGEMRGEELARKTNFLSRSLYELSKLG